MNEDTQMLNNGNTPPTYNLENPSSNRKPKKGDKGISANGKAVAAGLGGFVAGAAVGAGTAVAATAPADEAEAKVDEAVANAENDNASNHNLEPTPNPDHVILADNEGIRYAHIEADNFPDAFTQARAQVGPGGVFEYNGKIYSTYYESEWNNMSDDERAVFQNKTMIALNHTHSTNASSGTETPTVAHHVHHYHETVVEHHHHPSVVVEHHEPTVVVDHQPVVHVYHEQPVVEHHVIDSSEQLVVEAVDDVHVIGTESIQNADGDVMNLAVLESGGEQALVVDVDNNGMMDILAYDENHNQHFEPEEIHDISDAQISFDDLQAAQEYGSSDFYSTNDDIDFAADADVMSI